MTIEFHKFSSIENSYRKKYIEILEEHKYTNFAYAVTEKLDGANLSFWTDGNEVKVASRSQFVDSGFYNCGEVIERYSDVVKKIKNENFPDAEVIAIYGELIGPGIQKRIYYGKEKDFFAFEIAVDKTTLSVKHFNSIIVKYIIPGVPQIGIYESLDDALKVNNTFTSNAYKSAYNYNNEEYTKENIAEGVVIQPYYEPLRTGNGSRVIIKNKNEKFAEKGRKRKNKTKSPPNPFISAVEVYVTENRMHNVISKFGEVQQKDFGKIIGLMNADVIEEMIRDDEIPGDWKKHEKYKLFGKACSTVVSKFLKENLLKEI